MALPKSSDLFKNLFLRSSVNNTLHLLFDIAACEYGHLE